MRLIAQALLRPRAARAMSRAMSRAIGTAGFSAHNVRYFEKAEIDPIAMSTASAHTQPQGLVSLALTLYRAFLDAMPDPAWVKDCDGHYVAVNSAFRKFCESNLGRANIELLGADDSDLFAPDDAEKSRQEERDVMARRGAVRGELNVYHPLGTMRQFKVNRVALLDESSAVIGTLGFAHDVTDKAARAGRLRDSERKLDTLVRNLPGMAFRRLNDSMWSMMFASEGCRVLTGFPPREFVGNAVRSWGSIIALDDIEQARATIADQLTHGERYLVEYRIVLADGDMRWVSERGVHIAASGEAPAVLEGILLDITESRYYLDEMVHRATHDTLTGVANRPLLIDHLRHGIGYGQRYNRMAATLVINVDHFKYVNQSLGHDAGDDLLKEVAQRLQRTLREQDTVARLGADSFAMVLIDLENLGAAAQVMTRILAAVREPYTLGTQEIVVTCSVGCALYPLDGPDPETLLRRADTAMRHARNLGGDCHYFYSADSDRKTEDRLYLESNLRHAVARGELLLQYQPQMSARDGTLIGMEALVRWRHPELGLVSPGRFIPIAEETDLIVGIGSWVLEEACTHAKMLIEEGLPVGHVAVNLSARQFRDPGLIQRVGDILKRTGLHPSHLELEITESLVMKEIDAVIAKLKELKGLGLQLAIDDFGTGYSSLSYLRRFPIDRLKIDQSFTREVTNSKDGASIARAIIQLGHALELKVIAEGVETESQLHFLRENGCDEIQGFLYARPLDPPALREMLVAAQKTLRGA